MITIVGMGSKRGDLTLDGLSAIQQADVVVVKSQLTHAGQTVAEIRSDAIYCDDLFEQAEDFDHLNQLIVERLGSFGRKKVVFCVVGDGKDDSTVEHVKTAHVVNGVGLYLYSSAVSKSVRIRRILHACTTLKRSCGIFGSICLCNLCARNLLDTVNAHDMIKVAVCQKNIINALDFGCTESGLEPR